MKGEMKMTPSLQATKIKGVASTKIKAKNFVNIVQTRERQNGSVRLMTPRIARKRRVKEAKAIINKA